MISKDKLILKLQNIKKEELTSVSFRVLIGQLKNRLSYSNSVIKEDEIYKKFNEFVKKYSSLPAVQNDLNKYFN